MIIYFSGTGNSKYVADMLGKNLDDQVVDATKMIKNKTKGEFESKRPFVFISPNYTGQMPRVFQKFIKKSVFKGNKSAYFIVTCGVNIANIQNSLVSLCKYGDLNIEGDYFDYNYEIYKDERLIAKVTKEFLSFTDNYYIDVDFEDEAFVLALVVIIDNIIDKQKDNN